MKPEDFVETYFLFAARNEVLHGVPMLVTLAQAALESGWGRFAHGYNFFGIKAGPSWNGQIQTLKTTEYIRGKKKRIFQQFRKYTSPVESFEDHAKLLKERFPEAFEECDPVRFVMRIQNYHGHSYATDPNYVIKIARIIERIKKNVKKMEIN